MTKVVPVPTVLYTPSVQYRLSRLVVEILWVIIFKNFYSGSVARQWPPGESYGAPVANQGTVWGYHSNIFVLLQVEHISMAAAPRPRSPSSADAAVGELAGVEGAVDVEDGID